MILLSLVTVLRCIGHDENKENGGKFLMNPFLMSALLKGAEAVGQGVSDYAAADASFGKSEEQRLKELMRREELGTLGFTGEEQNRIMRDLLNPIQAREAQRAVETRSILGAGDVGAAQSAIANMIQADKGEAARAGATETYLQQQIEEKKLQEKELRALQKAQEAEEAAKTQAIIKALTLGIAGGAEEAQSSTQQNELLYGDAAKAATEGDMNTATRLRKYIIGSV